VVDVSRKDYREIADAIRELKLAMQESPIHMDWRMIASKFIATLKKDNPRFSEQKFWDYIER
jgi:predicted metal-dependent peptidase